MALTKDDKKWISTHFRKMLHNEFDKLYQALKPPPQNTKVMGFIQEPLEDEEEE